MLNEQFQAYQTATNGFEQTSSLFKSPRSRRWLVFFLIFIPCMLGSQLYIFLQPAIYQSVATVLTMAATDIDQPASPAADVQHVSIQKQILLGSAIMEKTAERLRQTTTTPPAWSADNLRNLFSVIPEPSTNLVHLQAQGAEPQWLQLAINAWIESYLQIRAAFIAESTEKVTTDISKQLQRIEQQVLDKRHEVDQFRLDHDILSTESTDNQAHARLQGLNKSLNTALEEEAKAKAKFDTLLDAISRNEMVVPEADSQTMAVLLQQAEKLRDQLAALEAQYTQEYIELNPSLRKVREQLVEIEDKITKKAGVGKTFARQEAENNYAAARQTVLTIKQQMQAHKKQAADYTTRFAEHQALQQELLKLENLQQETRQRLVDIEVKQRQNYPQVDVVDWASLPSQPISPNYTQESLLAFAISLGLALLGVMIMDYLNREPPPVTPMHLGGIHLHHQPHAVLDVAQQQHQVIYDPLKSLPADDSGREMTPQEVRALYQHADPSIKGIIQLLFNGLSLPEILSLTTDSLNIQTLMIIIPGRRNLLMNQSVAEWMEQTAAGANTDLNWPTEAEMETLLCCAAIDSGLPQPEDINVEVLRHTYMLFLLRQGIRLTDLTKIVGSLSPSQLLALGRYSPAQPNASIKDIKLDYFQSA